FSLISLVLALLILSLLRKLHCTRNYIHMNLFASFILRATAVLIKDTLISKNPNVQIMTKNTYPSLHWDCLFLLIVIICRTAQFFMHYFVGANYFWLLVEGIYLHTLLITAVLSGRRLLRTYIVIGWGKYIIIRKFLILWYFFECWATNEHMGIWWIIRGPVLFSIAVRIISSVPNIMHKCDCLLRIAQSVILRN
uniref:G-protein coupled receptors family 2 profile 2 domain-containing protein n=1 Tax=Accipiter nisus TaxID=211598 RepID=A0A8B9MM77_9AVES